MTDFYDKIIAWMSTDQAHAILRAGLALVVGLFLAWFLSRKLKLKRMHEQQSMLLRKVVTVAVLAVSILWALRELGLDMGVLLGAAGILTVAIGFASQTSASNIISGIFLMAERPFQIGDLIKIGDTAGYVLTIDFMSVKIRTFDNTMVRIPNESMLKSEVVNLTRFPIRRIDLHIGVAYKEDIERVRDLLLSIADQNPLALDEPAPMFLFKGYGSSSLDIQFSVWTRQEVFWDLKTQLYLDIKRAFDAQGIEIPFPHISVYTGSATEPMPVRLTPRSDKAN